jgi:glutamate N-acetyltransferase/amino-acid N-acetyltransferase
MDTAAEFIPSGGVTSPRGFFAGAVSAGIKNEAVTRLDLAILSSEKPCTAAAVFTTNQIQAAPVILTRQRISGGRLKAIVANSGIANACTGEPGMADAVEVAEVAAQHIGMTPEEVAVASTGIIGRRLPMLRLKVGIGKLELSPEGGLDFARAIMTTDTVSKEVAVKGDGYVIGGAAKGAGMIHPDMATMLGFITTDAPVAPDFLKAALREAVDASFNMISVDGDTSTNDMVIVLANGAAGGEVITSRSRRGAGFKRALRSVCISLARAIARDGEGATRLIEVKVTGAASKSDARQIARTVVSSSLVKTAVNGNDPNWGRVLAAVGYSGARVEADRIDLEIGGVSLVEKGLPVLFDRDELAALLSGGEVYITVRLHIGRATATAWGCDLSAEYVKINSEYTT